VASRLASLDDWPDGRSGIDFFGPERMGFKKKREIPES
jgi:hypothetical protein